MGHLGHYSIAKRQQRGLAVVEFAIVLPLLVSLFVAVAEFGVLFYTQTTLNKAVENGSRYVAEHAGGGSGTNQNRPVLDANLQTLAKQLVVYGNPGNTTAPLVSNLSTNNVSVTCSFGSTTVNGVNICNFQDNISAVTVSASITYQPILGNAMNGLFGVDLVNLTLTASAVSPMFNVQAL